MHLVLNYSCTLISLLEIQRLDKILMKEAELEIYKQVTRKVFKK